jgi:hypothetical protein
MSPAPRWPLMAVSRCNSVTKRTSLAMDRMAARRISGAEFSPLRRDGTTGNFTNVVPRVPVKTVLDTNLGLTLTIRRP